MGVAHMHTETSSTTSGIAVMVMGGGTNGNVE